MTTASSVSYDNISTIYDKIMSHVEYRLWVRIISKVLKRYSTIKNPKIFELGAGTGSLALLLKKRGFDITSSDLSFGMCSIARKKRINNFVADAKHIPVKKKYDLIIFLYDGINYLKSLKEYSVLFNEVFSTLNDDALFLFDITTKFNSLNNFQNIVDYEDEDNFTYIRHSYFNRKDNSQHNDFTIFEKIETGFSKRYDFHKQFIFTPDEILSALPKDKFQIEGIWDDFSFDPYTSTSERVHFLIRKIS